MRPLVTDWLVQLKTVVTVPGQGQYEMFDAVAVPNEERPTIKRLQDISKTFEENLRANSPTLSKNVFVSKPLGVYELAPMVPPTLENELPKIVCLCGSTKFWEQLVEVNREETMKGHIVLACGIFAHRGPAVHGREITLTKEEKEALDVLHLRKIDLCDEMIVVTRDGYYGDSTKRELEYAQLHHVPITFRDFKSEKTE